MAFARGDGKAAGPQALLTGRIPTAVSALPNCPQVADTKRHNVVLWLPRCLGGGSTVGDGECKCKGKGELWL